MLIICLNTINGASTGCLPSQVKRRKQEKKDNVNHCLISLVLVDIVGNF